MRASVLLGLVVAAVAQTPEDAVIRSGAPWFTVEGERMYAGGGNIYLEGGTYYLVGEGNKTLPPAAGGDCSSCFNLYKSTDLQNWHFVSCVVKNEDLRAAMPDPKYQNVSSFPFYRMERPKVFKCPATKKYMLWFHCDTDAFDISSVGVLSADSVEGPYAFVGPCFKPDGHGSYDMGIFHDDPAVHPMGDDKVYLVRSVDNSYAGVSQMTDDCTGVTGIVSGGTPKMEAQALMRDSNGVLHLAGSHETGWGPNGAIFLTSPNKSLVGAIWEDSYNPSGSGSTWNSQSTFLYPYRHANGVNITHIWMADRWNMWGPGSIQNFTAIWLPLIAPSGPSPSVVQAGFVAQLNKCNASDPTQQFLWTTSPPQVKHAGSGLCVTQGSFVDAVGNTVVLMYTNPCLGVVGGNQTWYRTGASFTNTSSGFGNDCMAWNSGGAASGNNVITYRCGNSTDWQSRFDAPVEPNVPGLFQAMGDSSPTGFCISGSPQWNPSLFTLPWQESWKIGDF